MNFTDKVVLITGAGTGMGAALARRFAGMGARVVGVGRRLEKLREVLGPDSERAMALSADVSQISDLERVVRTVRERFGRIDVLINNAGIPMGGSLADMTPRDLDYIIRVNLTGPTCLMQMIVPEMEARKDGLVVNIASMAALVPLPYQAPYCATKMGLSGFSLALRRELAQSGVRVVTVYPSTVETEQFNDETKAIANANNDNRFTLMTAEAAAEQILAGIRRNERKVIVTAGPERYLPFVNAVAPGIIDRMLAKMGPTIRSLMLAANKFVRARTPALAESSTKAGE